MVDKIWYNMEELIGGSEERGINRNIVECKAISISTLYCSSVVLIETQWNVKVYGSTDSSSPGTSINRNIVECKGRSYKEQLF